MKNLSIRISLFYCSNSLSHKEISEISNHLENVKLNLIGLPCAGKVDLLYLLKSIETGSDGVIVSTCKFGECKYLQGNYRAQKRAESVDDLVAETGYKKGHIKFLSIDSGNKIETLINGINDLAGVLRMELSEVQD